MLQPVFIAGAPFRLLQLLQLLAEMKGARPTHVAGVENTDLYIIRLYYPCMVLPMSAKCQKHGPRNDQSVLHQCHLVFEVIGLGTILRGVKSPCDSIATFWLLL